MGVIVASVFVSLVALLQTFIFIMKTKRLFSVLYRRLTQNMLLDIAGI